MIPYYFFPELKLGFIAVPVYPLMHGLAFTLMGALFLSEAKRKGLNHDVFFKLFLLALIGGIVGARIGGVLKYWDYFLVYPAEMLNFAQGGWSEAGGFLLAATFVIGYAVWAHLPLLTTFDTVAPALAARFAVSRFGCSAIHDHIGKVMAHPWPWGIEYFGEVRHETALYSLVAMSALFFILWGLRKRIKTPGFLFTIYLFGYSMSVFAIRFFRAEDLPYVSDTRYFGLTATQYIMTAVFISALFLYRYILRMKRTL